MASEVRGVAAASEVRGVAAAAEVGEFVGPWYSWWPGDSLPPLAALPGFVAGPVTNDVAFTAATGLASDELAARRMAGDRPYLATAGGEAIGWGWSATRRLAIGALGIVRALPSTDRYLWAFETAEAWRGRGVYPLLLQAILRHEAPGGVRAWIGHDPGNAASARGIGKAGFRSVGQLHRLPSGDYLLLATGPLDRARIGAALLGAGVHGDAGR